MSERPDVYDRFIGELTAPRRFDWRHFTVWMALGGATAAFVELVKWLA